MLEVESDEENQMNEQEADSKKVVYTKVTRPSAGSLAHKPPVKKVRVTDEAAAAAAFAGDDGETGGKELNADEVEYVDDDEYYAKFMAETSERAKQEDEMDVLRMQLQYEKEEAERKAKAAQVGDNGGGGGGDGGGIGNGDEQKNKTRVDEDGTVYEWDPVVKGYFPKISVNKLIEYQQAYKAPPPTSSSNPYSNLKEGKAYLINGSFFKWDSTSQKWTSIDQAVYEYVEYVTQIEHEWSQEENKWKAKSTPTPTPLPTESQQQQQPPPTSSQLQSSTEEKKTKPTTTTTTTAKKEGWFEIDDEKNTNVYVSGLPLDVTDDEFEKMMAKYGAIMKDPITHKLKCKLYKENNEVKGDGSVTLCIQMLDGSDYRGKKIKVEKAKFELKGTYDPSKAETTGEKKKKLNKNKEKKLIEKQRQKLLDWEDRPEVVRHKHEKVVVIKNLFNREDIEKDRTIANRLRDDLKTELEQYGEVKKVIIHERNPEGVVTVSFHDVDDADRCCAYLDNRVWKNGRIISCVTWDGESRFDQEETEEDQSKRIDEWHKFLESDD